MAKYQTKVGKRIQEYITMNKEQVFCANDIYRDMMEQGLNVNLATVYRNLDALTETGELVRYKASNNDSYVYRYDEKERKCHNHLHMQCRVCGKVYHLEGRFMSDISQYLDSQFGFEIECDNSTLIGVCKECRSL